MNWSIGLGLTRFGNVTVEKLKKKLIPKSNLKDLPEQEIIIWKRHGLN